MGELYGRTISLEDPDRWEDDDRVILSQAATITLATAPGTLQSAPLFGYDVTLAIGEGINAVSGRRLGARAAAALEEDERVRAVRVPVDKLLVSAASFDVELDPVEAGPFELTGPLTDEGVREALRQRDELEGA